MMHTSYSVEQIVNILDCKLIKGNESTIISVLSFDSRKLSEPESTIFFALKGRRDGHNYIADAYKSGVRNFVVSEFPTHIEIYKKANFFIVNNVIEALHKLVATHRRKYDYPVIGVTGSNGKTITKEWLYQLLAMDENIIRSPKSYNSQIGVPLSVWNLDSRHTLAIIEAGISLPGEMERLEYIIRPDIGILTNIGLAHSEGFKNLEEKISEKLALFKDAEIFIYNPKYLQSFTGEVPGRKHFTWGWNGGETLHIVDSSLVDDGRSQQLTALFKGKIIEACIPFGDAASIENAICCWATLLALGYDPQIVSSRLSRLQPVSMRLELKDGLNNCTLIDDSYSLDLSSLAIALNFLNQQNQHTTRTLVLSDIPGTGLDPALLYKQASEIIKANGVDRLIGIGTEIQKYGDLFAMEKQFFNDTSALLAAIDDLSIHDETVLLKGARIFEFERISKALVKKVHETVMEINLSALEANLNYYRSLLNPGVKITTMVKAFSYGSGSYEIANLLQFNKVDYLAVAIADEGVALRQAGITLPIMVLNPDVDGYQTMIEHDLQPEIYSIRVLNDFTAILRRHNKTGYNIHLKLDTGMHRLGFMEEELPALLNALINNDAIKVTSVFSHLTSSEDPESDLFTDQQIAIFERMTASLENALQYPFIKHISNTSAITRRRDAQFDMVRLGIGLYGVDSVYQGVESPLKTVATLKTCISQIKDLSAGDTVGYNRRGVMKADGRVATVKIGYADGYSRKQGNGAGKMLVNGQVVPTIGNICMDMCMIDISGVDAREGDEVIVFNDRVTVYDLARNQDTIPYEILTGISQRVKRVYFYE